MNVIFSDCLFKKKNQKQNPAIHHLNSGNFDELGDPNPDILGLLSQELNKNPEEEQSWDSV